MARKLFFVLGVCTGLLVGEVLRRHKLQALQADAAKLAEIKAFHQKNAEETEQFIEEMSTKSNLNGAMHRAVTRLESDFPEDGDDYGH